MARKKDIDVFLDAVRAADGRIGNRALRELLGWADEKYWGIHQQLFEAGKIEKGRGNGGTVILAGNDNPVVVAEAAARQEKVSELISEASALVQTDIRELELYEPVLRQLQKSWAARLGLYESHCEITALQGRRDTGGSWSRPDLVVVGVKKYEFLPDKILDVFSFEVKPAYDISIKGVLEALAHREAATKSYVIYHTAGRDFRDSPEAVRIEEIALRHGVGVYAAKDINDFDTWDERASATRGHPDPDNLERFIKMTLSDSAKSKLRRWF
ncbi:hypothetical protein NM680_09265 [Paracoccus sp. PS-1]|uniref:hypothetical protein n=1 Tax=unclassified Paracoccus (in: a-proteobacteria) TaxID=2688777 RepID=UPI00048B4E2D|nr:MULTISPECIES: hypothetical protein [unclassified Paracoccus (in: a-proteobacteria)]MDQ7261984.1 hypothetical protein [Paracoccus sp. PS1]